MAQTGSILRGRVIDSAGRGALKQANIIVYPVKDKNAIKNILTNEEGLFLLRNLPVYDTLELQITYTGYETYHLRFSFNGSNLLNLDSLFMKISRKALDTVVFKVAPPPMVVKKDSVEYNAAVIKTAPNAVVEDLLKKMPGLEVDAKGAITFNGKAVNRIMIDGKNYFAGDLLIAIRNLPADIVSRIQVTDTKTLEDAFSGQPSDGNKKTLNIKLKKNIKPFFGYITAGAGSSGRYELTGMVNHFNGPEQVSVVGSVNNLNKIGFSPGSSLEVINPGNGITEVKTTGINYNNEWGKKVKVSGSYFYSNATTSNELIAGRKQLVTPDSSFFSNSSSEQEDRTTGHRGQFTIEYSPDSLNRININPEINLIQSQTNLSNSTITNTATGGRINESRQNMVTSSNNNSYGLNIFWGRRFKKMGRAFTMTINTLQNRQHTNIFNQSNNVFYRSNVVDSAGLLNQQLHNTGAIESYTASIFYVEPLSPSLHLTIYENISISTNATDKEIYLMDSAGHIKGLDTLSSGSFYTRNTNSSTGFSLQHTGNKWDWNTGLIGIYNKVANSYGPALKNNGQRTQFNYAPQVSIKYHFAKEKNIQFYYSASTQQPQPEQLQPIPDNSNPLLVKLGNPGLKPSFTQSYILNYASLNAMKNMNASVQYTPVNNPILNSVYYDSHGRQLSQYVNVNGAYSLGANLGFSRNWKSNYHKLQINLGIAYNFNHDVSLVNNQSLVTATTIRQPTFGVQYSYKDLITVSGNYSVTGNEVHYNSTASQNINYIIQQFQNTFLFNCFKHLQLLSAINYTFNSNTPPDLRHSSLLWNLGLGQSLFKKQQVGVKLIVYDVLRQQTNTQTTTTPNYIENTQATVLRQYGLLSVAYNFKSK